MSDVPSELVREILVQLPAKSLFRLRSVCKEWLRVIDDSSFIKAHANNQLYNHTLVVGDDSRAPLYSFSLDSLNFTMNGTQTIDATLIKNPNPLITDLSASVASCNGLIMCISEVVLDDRDMLVILNPLTKEYHNLPQPNDALTNEYDYAYGFGYDSGSDDYKVVRIDVLLSQGEVVFQTLVYSLRLNSWRTVEDSPSLVRWKGALCDGALYWISRADWIIVALDLGTERYCQLPLPPTNNKYVGISLDALDGCLICSLNNEEKNNFDGWVMKDNGVEKSWIKLFSLPYSVSNAPRVVAYLKTKHQVILRHYLGSFLWFDIGNNSIKKFTIHGRDIASSIICPGSLVRLSDYHGGDTTLPKKKKKTTTKKTKKTNTRLKFCVRNAEEMCCSDYSGFCSEDSCLCCKEE